MFGFIMKTNTFITLSTATANVGVLVGLIFLLVELKQTRRIALSQIRQERTMSVIDEYASFARDRGFSDILHTSLDDGEFASLSKSDWNQIRLYELARTVRLEDVYFQYQRGLIDEVAYNFSLAMAASRLPIWKWLKIADPSPEFSKAIEAYIKDEDFKQTLLAAKFQEWADENPSPFGGLSSPFYYE